jgi:hypothetical protein
VIFGLLFFISSAVSFIGSAISAESVGDPVDLEESYVCENDGHEGKESENNGNWRNGEEVRNNCGTIMEYQLGNPRAEREICVYIAPSCVHCGGFINKELSEFLKKNGDTYSVKLRFLLTSKQDLFILKLIQNRTNNIDEHRKMYFSYIKYLSEHFDEIKISKKDEETFAECTDDGEHLDNGLAKYQKAARDGFESVYDKSRTTFRLEEIKAAFPDPDGNFEQESIAIYSRWSEEIKNFVKTKNNEIILPLMILNGSLIGKLPRR